MIRGVLGSRASIGGVLGSGRGGAAAAWYLAGGVSAANCVAAYQAKGAASLAASYINLANPGTYNAAPGVAPTFDTVNGWIFNANPFLTTGVTPSAGWSMIVRFSNMANTGIVAGSDGSGSNRFWIRPDEGATVAYAYGLNVRSRSPDLAAGVLGFAAFDCYRNGSADGTITASTPSGFIPITIGGRNLGASVDLRINATIQALAIYNTTLTSDQVAAISAAMAAL